MSANSEVVNLDMTPSILYGLQRPSSVDEKMLMYECLNKTRAAFPCCCDIFSKNGLEYSDLQKSIFCISLFLHHGLEKRRNRNDSVYFCCPCNTTAPKSRRKPKIKDKEFGGHACCPFCLHFKLNTDDKKWYFSDEPGINSVSIACSSSLKPLSSFITKEVMPVLVNHILEKIPFDQDIITPKMLYKAAEKFITLDETRKRWIREIMRSLNGTSKEKILEAEQKVEHYIRQVNCNGDYGAVLYDNGDLVVPGSNPSTVKSCSPLDYSKCICPAVDCIHENYWDKFPSKVVGEDEKEVLLTFEAVRGADPS